MKIVSPVLALLLLYSLPLSSQDLLFDNGAFINIPGTPSVSAPQTSTLGHETLGFQVSDNVAGIPFTLADDIVITDESLEISSVVIFAYMPGELPSASPFLDFSLQIWDGDPREEGSIVWGDHTTNLLTSTDFTGAFRTDEDDQSNPFRPIYAVELTTPDLVLEPGTYWFHFKNDEVMLETANVILGPIVPFVTINGVASTGNAILNNGNSNSWSIVRDFSTDDPQGIPFQVFGSTITSTTNDNNLSRSIQLVQNPVEDVLRIDNSLSVNIEKLSVYNLLGQEIITKHRSNSPGIEEIDVRNLIPGTYLLVISSENTSVTKKFIKR